MSPLRDGFSPDSIKTHDKHEALGSDFSDHDQQDVPSVPDGGLRAWMTVAGAWLVMFSTFGYLYSFGIYQNFYTLEYLHNHTPSTIAWIGSFQLMSPFAFGIISGKLFDNGYFHALEIVGGAIFTFSLFMLSLTKPFQYYQVCSPIFRRLLMGIGLGLVFIPTVTITSHHFDKRRSLATGIVLSGSSAGANSLPDHHLIPKIGFPSAVRATAYIVLGTIVLGNAMMRTRPRPARAAPDLKSFFTDGAYLWGIIGCLLSTTGIYLPLIYIQLYAVQHSVGSDLAFYSIAIMNGTSAFGRVFATYFADIYGPFYLHVACTLVTAGTIWAVLGVHNAWTLVLVSVLYGVFSGLALSIGCLASLARSPDEVGARTGIALTLGSFGSLSAAPIQGALLTREFLWIRPVSFSGAIVILSAGCFASSR
ncbi:MFS general substrate transporter [Mycena rebaudengoi]|nr:MFS general substrate transporter [Mycena rebaudengoi]